ncbi:CLUMA_CG001047, isoform A [Clunio marinus]|uniref:CLUMA_CG001047, isoform A n=1 Tax=Clunio marinus TaxID=568069 RepID=A0A1J1HGX9_9DIPT|nr:CLUMA_CG001047, isoform A [Clunio marinus]
MLRIFLLLVISVAAIHCVTAANYNLVVKTDHIKFHDEVDQAALTFREKIRLDLEKYKKMREWALKNNSSKTTSTTEETSSTTAETTTKAMNTSSTTKEASKNSSGEKIEMSTKPAMTAESSANNTSTESKTSMMTDLDSKSMTTEKNNKTPEIEIKDKGKDKTANVTDSIKPFNGTIDDRFIVNAPVLCKGIVVRGKCRKIAR